MTTQDNGYSAKDIKVLEGLEAVRKRPAMYIGNTGIVGLHHLISEVVDNSIDEALAGYCSDITITLTKDGGCRVEDNGRGIPVDIQEQYGVSALEIIMTKLHAGGKFEKDAYKVSGGLHGVGVSCVNALSIRCDVEVHRDGNRYFHSFSKGIPQGAMEVFEGEADKEHGTTVVFYPDEEIFKEGIEFHYDRISERFRELAFLNPGVKINVADERDGKSDTFFFENGILEQSKSIMA